MNNQPDASKERLGLKIFYRLLVVALIMLVVASLGGFGYALDELWGYWNGERYSSIHSAQMNGAFGLAMSVLGVILYYVLLSPIKEATGNVKLITNQMAAPKNNDNIAIFIAGTFALGLLATAMYFMTQRNEPVTITPEPVAETPLHPDGSIDYATLAKRYGGVLEEPNPKEETTTDEPDSILTEDKPYSIITKDGITINNIPAHIPSDAEILKREVAREREKRKSIEGKKLYDRFVQGIDFRNLEAVLVDIGYPPPIEEVPLPAPVGSPKTTMTALDVAKWLRKNSDKQGTPEFARVLNVFKILDREERQAEERKSTGKYFYSISDWIRVEIGEEPKGPFIPSGQFGGIPVQKNLSGDYVQLKEVSPRHAKQAEAEQRH